MREERSAGAVVARLTPDPVYLLLKYRGGHWGHVKGHVEEGESLRETVLRELEEETGVSEAGFVEGFQEGISYTFRRGGDVVDKRVDFFLALTPERDVRVGAPEEHTEVGWFGLEEALDRVTFEDSRDVLVAAHERLEEEGQARLDRFEDQG